MIASRKLLVLDAAYSYSTVRLRSLEHSVLSRDLDGFFEHVWNVHPFVGADAESDSSQMGRLKSMAFGPRHTIIEIPVGRFDWLWWFPALNFLIGQVGLVSCLLRLARRERISAVRVGDPYYLGLVGLLIARVNRIPLVIRINANYDAIYQSIGRLAYPRLFRRRWVEKKVDRFVLQRADLVIGANAMALEYALSNGARPLRASVVRYGSLIDPLHFEDPRKRGSVRHELNIGDSPFVACVSRLEMVKHPEDVIHALSVARKLIPDLCAVLIGDGSQSDNLRALVIDLDMEAHVRLVGNRSQTWIANCLTGASAVAAPMAGRALVESLLSGTPVVAYDIDWHSEIIQDETTGVLVPYRDVDQFGYALARVVSDASASEMGLRGRTATMQMMNPDLITREEKRLYEKLLGRPHSDLRTGI